MYSLKIILFSIRKRCLSYLFIFTEIVIGIVLLSVFSNLLYSVNHTINSKKLDRRYNTYYINYGTYLDGNFQSSMGMEMIDFKTLENYNAIEDGISSNTHLIMYSNDIRYYTKDEKDLQLDVFYTAPEFLDYVFEDQEHKVNGNTIYVGKNALYAMENGLINSPLFEGMEQFQNYSAKTKEVTLMNGNVYHVELYKPGKQKQFELYNMYTMNQYSVDNMIVLPYSECRSESNRIDQGQIEMGVYFTGETNGRDLHKIITMLEDKYSDAEGQFSYTSGFDIYSINVLNYQELGQVVSLVSIACIIIVTAGLFAYNLMQFQKRKREYAIKKSIGATDTQLLQERVLESCIVTFSGGILGSIISIFILKQNIFKNEFFTIRINDSLIAVFIICSILIGVIASIYSSIMLKRLRPIQILKDK